tara:strand:- start:9707 stop:10372 length:666 start_codon:yes stop_codon:yes gene_type:complete
MVSATAAASLGALSGAWAYPLHGAEQDAEKLTGSGMIKTLGLGGIIFSFLFIIIFAAMFIKIIDAPLKPESEVKTEEDINEDKLSREVKRAWLVMHWLSIFSMIFGFITMIITTIINEGFVLPGSKAGGYLLRMIFFFGLGGTALTLAFVIGMLCVKWPKSKDVAKSTSEKKEDNKLYSIIRPNIGYGVILSIFFLVPVVTIMATEFDENKQMRSVIAKMT